MNSLCEEPNPLGDEILFYSSDGTERFRKLVEASKLATAISHAQESQKNVDMCDNDIHNIHNSSSNNIDQILSHIDNDDSYNQQNKTKNDEKLSFNDYNENKNSDDKSSSDDRSPNFNGSMTIRQQQKFLLNYAAEADELANDAADRLRMIYKIGMI